MRGNRGYLSSYRDKIGRPVQCSPYSRLALTPHRNLGSGEAARISFLMFSADPGKETSPPAIACAHSYTTVPRSDRHRIANLRGICRTSARVLCGADRSFDEGFLMRIPTLRCVWVRERPALENLPRMKLRRSGGTYGESALTRLMRRRCQRANWHCSQRWAQENRDPLAPGHRPCLVEFPVPQSSICLRKCKRRRLSSEIVCTLHISGTIAVQSGRIWQWITISFRNAQFLNRRYIPNFRYNRGQIRERL